MALISLHLLPLTLLLLTTIPAALSLSSPPHLKLPLIHRRPPTPSEALSADKRRLSAALLRRRSPSPSLPVTSAAASGSGQYLVALRLGTPPQRVLLVADTGSDLTWVSCSPCRGGRCRPRAAAAFLPRRSATFAPHRCSDRACGLVPHPENPARCNRTRRHASCRYEYSYADGSVSGGFFSRETTTFNSTAGGPIKFPHLAFGCGFWNSGPSLSGSSFNGANGVLGLGRGPISFPSQLGRAFGHKFSYCLMDYTLSPPATSYLFIGGAAVSTAGISYTPLLTNPLSPTFYYIGIEGISVNGVNLRIHTTDFAIDRLGNGGTVLDSGTTLTFLAEPAYQKVLAAFGRLVKLPKPTDSTPGFDFCLNVSRSTRASFPQLSFKLGGGSNFSPPPRNYFIDTSDGVKCLALQPVTSVSSSSVIGNLMQQGYTFEFDRDRSRLGFTRRGCAVA